MADVIVAFVGHFVQDVGEVTVEGCVRFAEASMFEASEAVAADEVTAETNSIGGCKCGKQMLQEAKCHQL